MAREKPRPSRGLPDKETLLARLRSQGRHPQSLPSLEDHFEVPRERAREFQNLLKSLVEAGLARRVKGRKFVAEEAEGPGLPRRARRARESLRGEGSAIDSRAVSGDRPAASPSRPGRGPDPDREAGKTGRGTRAARSQDARGESAREVSGFESGPGSAGKILYDSDSEVHGEPESGQDEARQEQSARLDHRGRPKGGQSRFLPRGGRKGGFRKPPEEGRARGQRSTGRDREEDGGQLVKGKLIRQGGFHFVRPARPGGEEELVLIPRKNLGQAKPGDLVSARIVEEDGGERIGRIVATLEEEISFAEVSKHFFRENNIPYGYPKKALQEAGTFPEPVWEALENRSDFRDRHIITIDPATAKDHDDAISLQRRKDGTWLLGVHIADVAEYVAPESSLDREAVERAFTQYLPWTAAPMLPQRLSSDLCSLLEGRERLAFSCLMEVDPEGGLKKFEFVESFIRVERFYSYEEAQAARDAGDPFLQELDEFTSVLLARRRRDGFIDFQFPEPKVEMKDGAPARIYPAVRLASNSWIEECMLLANQATAMYLTRHKLPGLFRVHEQPDLDVVAELWAARGQAHMDKGMSEVFEGMSPTRGNLNPAIQKFFIRLLGREGGALPPAVQRKVLQSMKKAQYSAEPLGHFALGWLHYAHFTSPIRRYADLWTHRVIKAHVRGQRAHKHLKALARDVAERISEREIAVMKVERRSFKTATAWVLREHVGREFVGEVSGLENFGIFVSIADPMGEGLIPIRCLRDDYYEKDEETGHLVGRRTRQRFELGDKVRVRLDRSDPFSAQVDFDFLGRA
jgi:ribonuclease R